MMAGQLCSRIGAYDNAALFRADVPTLAHYLRDAGYRTALSGKMHFVGPDQLHGFEERLTTDVYPADFGWTPDWTCGERRFWFHSMQSVVEAGVYDRTLNLDYDEEVCFTSLRQLYDMARDDDERPFFFTVSFIQPHDPYMTPRAYWDRYVHDDMDMPTVAPILPAQRDPHSRRLYDICRMDEYEISEGHIRNARHAYYGMVTWLDEQLGKLLAALEVAGLADNTVIILTADHGDMLGERGMWYKMSFFEPSLRVPLIVHAPGMFTARRVHENVSLVDLLPTFIDLATDGLGVEPVVPLDGDSLIPLLDGSKAGWRGEVAAEHLAEGTTEPAIMLKRGTWKYITCKGDPPQLFDVENDPNELQNLADKPRHAGQRKEFETAVAARWDSDAIRGEVIASQQRRMFVQRAMLSGKPVVWDHDPPRDAAAVYNRNYGSELYESDRKARIPRRDAPRFDGEITKRGSDKR
ncbi:MAG: choline-sulfatase, partial [Gammaproteobacteria bacterium]